MVETLYIGKKINRVEQGDLIEGLLYTITKRTGEEISFDEIEFPYTVVITQDCDLEQDFDQRIKHEKEKTETAVDHDKYLGTVCLLPAYNAEAVHQGTHLSKLGLAMKKIDSDRWKPLKQNQVERFHYLNADTKLGIPDLIIDFKHQYTIERSELYARLKTKPEMRRYRIDDLFREDLSSRFANFFSRIPLPLIQTLVAPYAQP